MQYLAAILGVLGLFALPWLKERVHGTTLLAPWYWATASGVMLQAVVFQGADEPLLNYAAAVTTLLPAAAIYGAKRPQDRGWQWIVAALLVMLLWPAGECWLLDQRFELAAQPLRSWFLVVLLAVQWGNWSITANAGLVSLLTAAQAIMLWPQLPWGDGEPTTQAWLLGAALLSIVPWWLSWNLLRTSHCLASSDETTFPTPRELAEWRWFRAAYGVVWALRAMERINEVAKLRQWSWHWSWSGPVANEKPRDNGSPLLAMSEPAERAVWRQLWQNIFRRFLSVSYVPEDKSITSEGV